LGNLGAGIGLFYSDVIFVCLSMIYRDHRKAENLLKKNRKPTRKTDKWHIQNKQLVASSFCLTALPLAARQM
jgi:uncharacterized protein YktB (UPF0637 family)